MVFGSGKLLVIHKASGLATSSSISKASNLGSQMAGQPLSFTHTENAPSMLGSFQTTGLRERHAQSLAIFKWSAFESWALGNSCSFPENPWDLDFPAKRDLEDNLLPQPHFTDEKTEAKSMEAPCPETTSSFGYELGPSREAQEKQDQQVWFLPDYSDTLNTLGFFGISITPLYYQAALCASSDPYGKRTKDRCD